MSYYRRWRIQGGTYFFTVVTYRRRELFVDAAARTALRKALSKVSSRWPFRTVAMILMPDHWHAVWELPRGDDAYSKRMQKVKESFSTTMVELGVEESGRTQRQRQRRERAYWQPRYWEHTVRDEMDLKRCVDYLHFNPDKHQIVANVADYPWSTFHRFVREGEYGPHWGRTDPWPGFEMPE